MKFYNYSKCGTCVKAKKYLETQSISIDDIAIRETPPSVSELKLAAKTVGIKRLFNTSGLDYRSLNIKDKLPTLSEDQIFDLLHGNGNLIKRPFVVHNGQAWTGFKENEWESFL